MAKISLAYPDSWLTIYISVKNRDTWVEVFTGLMTEVGTTAVYKYDFKEQPLTDYAYVATTTGYNDMNWVIYREWEIWARFNSVTHIDTKLNKMWDKMNQPEKHEEIIEKLDIAKEQIINRIEVSENEICKDIKGVNKELKEDNVSTRQLVRQKAKKQEEFIQKQLDSEAKTQEMIESEADEIEEEIEKILEQEADMIEKDMEEQFNREADEIESNQTANGN